METNEDESCINNEGSSLPEPDCDDLDNLLNLGEDEISVGNREDLQLSFSSLDNLRIEEDDAHSMDGFIAPKHDATTKPRLGDTEYILGTLIVRVVEAKDIKPIRKGGMGDLIFGEKDNRQRHDGANKGSRSRDQLSYRRRQIIDKGSSNPFATILFNNQSQRTSTIFDTVNPIWPREFFYFDVSLQVTKLAQDDSEDIYDEKKNPNKTEVSSTQPNNLLIASLSNARMYDSKKRNKNAFVKSRNEDEEDFLGMTKKIDTTPLITGKEKYIDEWINLEGDEDISGRLRLILEYVPSEVPPRPGDLVQFTGFVRYEDVFPVGYKIFRVDNIHEDEVTLSYRTPEGWTCNFTAHRFMLITVNRYNTAIERYQEEIIELAEKLSHSPAVHSFGQTVCRLPEDGLLSVGLHVSSKSINLLGRWLNHGVEKALDDTIYAFNMDGQHSPRLNESDTNDNASQRSNTDNHMIDEGCDISGFTTDELTENSRSSESQIDECASTNVSNNAEITPSLCVVCMTQLKSVILLPCNHLCVCKECSNHPSLKSCPICRKNIVSKNEVYW